MSNQFHTQSWTEREKWLGDEAEHVFSQLVGEDNCVKYGLDRPPIHVGKLPEFVRFTPDYLQEHRAVEVVGMGHDGVLKIKVQKLLALMKWNEFMPVYVFIWNGHLKEYTLAPVTDIWRRCHEAGKVVRFHEGNLAWFLPVAALAASWHARL